MASKASGVWKSPLNSPNNEDDTSFPGLKPTGPDTAWKIQYHELQQNELLALEAIYGEDFVMHTSPQTAWQVSAVA